MKITHLVLFTGGVETLDYFSVQLANAFRKMGYQIFIFDLTKEDESMEKIFQFIEIGQTAVVTFNYTGISGEEVFLDENDNFFWDKLNIHVYNIVVDHPFYYPHFLEKRPKRYIQYSIDREHELFMERFYANVPSGGYLPLGGTQYKEILPYEKRPIQVMFAGNYTPPSKFERFITRLDKEYEAFYYGIIDDLIAHPDLSMDKVFETHLRDEIPDIDDKGLCLAMGNMTFIDLYVRFYFRGKVIKTLAEAGIQIHTFGNGYDKLDCKRMDCIHQHGPVNSLTCLKQIGQSKISLNVMPWFKQGFHDRIFNTMLNGAVCVTDGSSEISKEFRDGEEICLYSLKDIEALPDRVNELLKHEDLAKEMTTKAYGIANAKHTWECRARKIRTDLEKNFI